MRKRVRMTFLRGKNVKGFMGHWSMNYYVENIIDLDSTKTSTYNSSSIQNIPYQKISYQSPVFITKTIYQNVTYQKQSLRSIQTHFKTSLLSKHKKELSYLSIFPIRKPELNIFNFSSSFYITKKRYPLPQVENIDTLSNENISKINYVEDTDKSLITDPNPFIISKNKSFPQSFHPYPYCSLYSAKTDQCSK